MARTMKQRWTGYLVAHLKARWFLLPLSGFIALLHIYRDGYPLAWIKLWAVFVSVLFLIPLDKSEKNDCSDQTPH
jgi:hypothetical protein